MSKKQTRRAFSYVRFSHHSQAAGGGLARQEKLTREYCERNGLTLDDSLTLSDLGVSAFRGANVREGALAGFLEACKTGRVPRGSVLIVESLDRLSRDQIRPALQLFLQLQDYGITIVTHQPAREYKPESTDALALIEPLIVFARGHEESAMKSHRRREGWKQARDRARRGGGPMGGYAPCWLRVEDGRFVVDKAKAATVRLIYSLARDGMGAYQIARRLDRDGVQPIGRERRWTASGIGKLLLSPAVVGDHQPRRREGRKSVPDGPVIPDFYPAVLSREEWAQARASVRSRTMGRGSGRVGRGENLFSGLVRCALSGEKLWLLRTHKRGKDGSLYRYTYLGTKRQSDAAPAQCRIDYRTFERAVLSCLEEVRPDDLRPGDGEDTHGAEEVELVGRLLDIDGRMEKAKGQASTADDFDDLLDIVRELRSERGRVSKRLEEIRDKKAAGDPASVLGEAKSLTGMLDSSRPGERDELRRRLKVRLRSLIAEAMVLIVPRGRARLAAVQLFFRTGAVRDYCIDSRRPQEPLSGVFPAGLDLRRREDAAELERLLSVAELGCPRGD